MKRGKVDSPVSQVGEESLLRRRLRHRTVNVEVVQAFTKGRYYRSERERERVEARERRFNKGNRFFL